MHLLVTDTLTKKVGAWIRKPVSCGVTTICPMLRNTSPSQRIDQAVDCGLCNVVPTHFQWLDIGGNWNTLSFTLLQSIPKILNG
jgi:hypothetical protein